MKKRQILDISSSVIAQAQASGVPESTVQCLVGLIEELVNDGHAHAKEAVVVSPDASRIRNLRESPFSCLNTESKRMRHFELNPWSIFLVCILISAEIQQKSRHIGKFLSMRSSCIIMGSLSSIFMNSELSVNS